MPVCLRRMENASIPTEAPHASRLCRHYVPSSLRFGLESADPFPWRNSAALGVAPSKGTCRYTLMVGTLRVHTADKSSLCRFRSLNVTRPESPASTSGLTHGRHTCYRYVSQPLLTPSLSRCGTPLRRWGFLSVPTPELPASASGIGTGRFTCYAWLRHVPQLATQPRGRHLLHTQDLTYAMTTLRVGIDFNVQRWC